MFRVEDRPGVRSPVADDDGDEGGGGDSLASLKALLDCGVALAVVEVDRVLPSLGSLHFLRPGDLQYWDFKLPLVLALPCPHLVFLPLQGLSHGDESAVDVSVEAGLVPVSAGEGELRNEGDGRQDLAVRGGVGGGLHLGLGAGTEDGSCQHEDTNYGQHPGAL